MEAEFQQPSAFFIKQNFEHLDAMDIFSRFQTFEVTQEMRNYENVFHSKKV